MNSAIVQIIQMKASELYFGWKLVTEQAHLDTNKLYE